MTALEAVAATALVPMIMGYCHSEPNELEKETREEAEEEEEEKLESDKDKKNKRTSSRNKKREKEKKELKRGCCSEDNQGFIHRFL